MIFFPIRTDRRLRSTPWVNYALIAVNVVVFMLTFADMSNRATQTTLVNYYLWPTTPALAQFFTYQFLHGGPMHLLGNMVFLYVFGNSVEDRLGHVGYLLFYLGCGVLAGLGHLLTATSPVIGASGAIAGVTGAYLALFPLSNVTIFYWFFFIGYFEVSSIVLILFSVARDFLFQFMGTSNVAYSAHLAGYAAGFVVGMGLLMGRMLPREPYDMLALIEQRRRRTRFQRMTRQGYQPWEATRPGAPPRESAPELSEPQRRLAERRRQIAAAIEDHDLPRAASLYADLAAEHPGQVLSKQNQLDVANQLMSEGRYDQAATAYELFLKTYRAYPERHHIELILGLIYARYLDQPARARELLARARPRLDGSNLELAQHVLTELREP